MQLKDNKKELNQSTSKYKTNIYQNKDDIIKENKASLSNEPENTSFDSTPSVHKFTDYYSIRELLINHLQGYPPEEAKLSLAKAIVQEFPKLKDNHSSRGYELYYDPIEKRGFIEYRLWNCRKNAPKEKKKYTKKDSKTLRVTGPEILLLLNEELLEKISYMKNKNPSMEFKAGIESCLEETFANRRHWIIKENPTITQIFDKYPRLLDYHGEMIHKEFNRIYNKMGDNFLIKFPFYYCQRILEYAKTKKSKLFQITANLLDNNLRTLQILAQMLPVPIASLKVKTSINGKQSRASKRLRVEDEKNDAEPRSESSFLFEILPENTNIEEFMNELKIKYNSPIQPFIACIKCQNENLYFIVADEHVSTGHNATSIVEAFDLLFKIYFILNLCYPNGLQYFYNFIENYVYKIGEQSPALVRSTHITLTNVDLLQSEENEFVK